MELEDRLIDIGDLYRQYSDVLSARVSADAEYSASILDLTASPEDVEAWYFSHDPLESSYYFALDTMAAAGDPEDLHQFLNYDVDDAILLGRGGVMLLASTIFGDVYSGGGSVGIAELYDKYYKPLSDQGLVPQADKLDHIALQDLCMAYLKLAPVAFDTDDLPRLLLSAEMLRISTGNFNDLIANDRVQIVDQNSEHEIAEAVSSAESDDSRIIMLTNLLFKGGAEGFSAYLSGQSVISSSILNYLSEQYRISPDQSSDENDAQFDNVRMTALRARMTYASTWMSDVFKEEEDPILHRSQEEFGLMVGMMKSLFCDDSLCNIRERIKSPDIKGSLHELLWFIDAYALRMLSPDVYREIRTVPVYSRDDAPKIGYPTQSRNIDMKVIKGQIMDLIQLKSSPKRAKISNRAKDVMEASDIEHLSESDKEKHFAGTDKYHPEIITLHEPNFMEVNPRRLAAKLNMYFRWFESGFDPSMKADVLRFVMPSVKWEYEMISGKNSDRTKQLRRIMKHNFILPKAGVVDPRLRGMNREQRRRQERAKRRKKH